MEIQLLFSKFKKQFLNFQLESAEYSDICIWKFIKYELLFTKIKSF